MNTMKQFFKHFHIGVLFKGLSYTLIFSAIYNFFFLGTTILSQNVPWMIYIMQAVLNLIFSLGMYKICTMVWQKKPEKITGEIAVRILLLQGVYMLFVSGICNPMYMIAQNQTFALVLVQLLSAMGIIFMIPIQLIYYYALFLGKRNGKEIFLYVKNVMKTNYKGILNAFCGLFLVIICIDTLTMGIFTIVGGFNATALLTNMFYAGNPLVNCMTMLFASSLANLPLIQILVPVFFSFIVGFFYAWLEMNYVYYVQEKCIEYGTQRTKNNR